MKGKVAFVSGAGSGIGKATALKLAGLGAHVIVTDINDENGQAVTDKITNSGGQASYYHLDVAERASVENCFAAIGQKHGPVHFSVNNAGIGGAPAAIHEIKIENWQRMIDINLTGVFHCLQAQIKMMLATQTQGCIVNVSSLAGLNGVPGGGSYVAAKHAVIGLTKTAAKEYAQAGIRVNAVCPGFVETNIIKGVPDNVLDFNNKFLVPMKRLGKPEEIADAIAWLLGDQSSFVTGHSLHLDGGLMA